MSDRVVIDFAAAEGAVSRIVGLVERRGFRLCSMVMAEGEERASLTLDLEPRDPARHLDVLGLQLSRLHEVSSVSFPTPASGQVQ